MTDVAITGATGNVGREAIAALPEHDLSLFSHSDADELETEPFDVQDREAFVAALEGIDVLVHLAANPSPTAEWDAVSGPNVEGTYNAYEAALENDLERVVFASSNHAVNMGNVTSPVRPETTGDDPDPVRPDEPPRPDTYYGVTKVLGEAMGYYYARRHGLEVVNLRIGWLLSREDLRTACAERDGPGRRYARAMWLSPEDCRRAIHAAVTATLEETPVTAHAISNNSDRFLSLTETSLAIGYHPQDDSAAVFDGDGTDGNRDGLDSP
ncbi:NAD-dependent epimerase/dehydratase family protein [Natrialbaceae archaeon AArc-T1-2]|uniref:NAD-dependent epimerase/dehydratase family protein n=1 Tax=Natrialbaceae archaeon AArc-T1-2 TaxID=3053904 RepID=UPI00255AD8AE|nr:NAD(P)-dependent oxidoreductase [Natrialbaceae archaeon AArc-T1-2]WIV66107.1 NAD(P)-dependent oxidoreductase [Natrialbaceae archaeon AArc-T1-2]